MEHIRFGAILVAVADPACRVQPSLDRGVQLAKATGARLVLFHAAFDSALSGRPFFDSMRLARSRGSFMAERLRLLEKRASALRVAGIEVDVSVSWEEPAHEAVIRSALREKVDLVVAGRHEHRAGSPFRYRLTDWELMRLCPRPLLVVHPMASMSAGGAVLAALDPTHAHDKPASLDARIVRHASAIANALGVDCHAMHSMPPGSYPVGASIAARKRFDQRMHAKIKKITAGAGTDLAAVHIRHGGVARSLPSFAARLPAQIVAMGIISRRWMDRFVIGDTAESVIREVPCDLLLIKPENFTLRLGRIRKEAVVLPRGRTGSEHERQRRV